MKELLIEFGNNHKVFDDEIKAIIKLIVDTIVVPNYESKQVKWHGLISSHNSQEIQKSAVYYNMGFNRSIIAFPNSNITCFMFNVNDVLNHIYKSTNYDRKQTKKIYEFLTNSMDFYNQPLKTKTYIYDTKEIIKKRKNVYTETLPNTYGDIYVDNKEVFNFKNENFRFININIGEFPQEFKKTTILFHCNHLLVDFTEKTINEIFSFLSYILFLLWQKGRKCDFNFSMDNLTLINNELIKIKDHLVSMVDKECILYRQQLINNVLSKYSIPNR